MTDDELDGVIGMIRLPAKVTTAAKFGKVMAKEVPGAVVAFGHPMAARGWLAICRPTEEERREVHD